MTSYIHDPEKTRRDAQDALTEVVPQCEINMPRDALYAELHHTGEIPVLDGEPAFLGDGGTNPNFDYDKWRRRKLDGDPCIHIRDTVHPRSLCGYLSSTPTEKWPPEHKLVELGDESASCTACLTDARRILENR